MANYRGGWSTTAKAQHANNKISTTASTSAGTTNSVWTTNATTVVGSTFAPTSSSGMTIRDGSDLMIEVDGKMESLTKLFARIEAIEKRLTILPRNAKLEKEYPMLVSIYEDYEEAEKEIIETFHREYPKLIEAMEQYKAAEIMLKESNDET